jgi:His-Xaa-Ser system protein HxsD
MTFVQEILWTRRRDDILEINLDPEVYGIKTALKVAHEFSDRCVTTVTHGESGKIRILISHKDDSDALEAIAGDLLNSLADHRLREILSEETAPVRNLILAHALRNAGLSDI